MPTIKREISGDLGRRNSSKALPPALQIHIDTRGSSSTLCGDPDHLGSMSPLTELPENWEDDFHKSVPSSYEDVFKEGAEKLRCIKEILGRIFAGVLPQNVWNEEMEALMKLVPPRVCVALYGVTGAGKSSLINAILDDMIVSTSGMEACTAVVTEISYRKQDGISAEVEFLSVQEWSDEISLVLGDLSSKKARKEIALGNPDDPGVIAWRKIQAVYPGLKLDAMGKMTLDDVLNQNGEIKEKLGTTVQLEAKNSTEFQGLRAPFMQSSQTRNNSSSTSMQWPLVRRMRIFCNAPALSTGIVLVDLPGNNDANAARSAIAESHMKNSDCIWIISPANRAMSDKSAQDFLDKALRNQLISLEAASSNAITIIATKCDDVEASEYLALLDDKEQRDFDNMKKSMDELQARKASMTKQDRADEEMHTQKFTRDAVTELNNLVKKFDTSSSSKRYLESEPEAPPKRRKISSVASSDSPANFANEFRGVTQKVLTLMERDHSLQEKIFEIEKQIEGIQNRINALCASVRTKAIVRKLKETAKLEFQNAKAEMDEEIFDPEKDDPDEDDGEDEAAQYSVEAINDECLSNLLVFASSARDYQRLMGITPVNGKPSTFTSTEETQIPALQNHCHVLAAATRVKAAREFVTRLDRLLVSIIGYLSEKGTIRMTKEDRRALQVKWCTRKYYEENTLPKCILKSPESGGLGGTLEKKLDDVAFDQRFMRHIRNTIGDKLEPAKKVASKSAFQMTKATVEDLHWTTFRAIMRREGKWKSFDVNKDLADLFLQMFVKDWRTLFSAQFFEDESKPYMDAVDEHLNAVVASLPLPMQGDAHEVKKAARKRALKYIVVALASGREFANKEQKRIPGVLTECMKNQLKPTYADVLEVTGVGCIRKQKIKFPTDLRGQAEEVFAMGAQEMWSSLEGIATATGAQVNKKVKKACKQAEMDMSKLWLRSGDAFDQPKSFVQALAGLKIIRSSLPSLAERCGAPLPTAAS
ncbi:hypothetical protein SCHPADRAFT_876105 [Schizopora paradoxa]|uniref:Dynamin N-terminal domain-containing protein n=1 Tax=Schizopora paradoxa TaxID=27342 RepID=A0A0H2RJE0_9AGAM|nr:hypothetical protein SCHPADRAFT_876105 [Schizopora paradoxa]